SGDSLAASSLRSYEIADEVSARFNDLTKAKKKSRLPLLGRAPANASVDLEEEQSDHFARGLNLYKLLLILYIGSFAGVVVELLWCFLRNGHFESRAGLVYGPFNLLYGAGATLLTLFLYRYRNRGRWLSFLVGMAVGSAVEYCTSWAQETFLGSRSWDYSEMPFNLNGRICLLYSVFWGILGIFWLKNLYPRMAAAIIHIPNRWGKILTWALFAFFVFDAVVSLLAVMRWRMRVAGIAAPGAFWNFIDLRFPDERMRKVYANLVWS
ncbi:MAG: putative ABC transporter permease, partial [Clostridia bacterium]|nr:putative ABC transporter permease [Clostridia bacterium]